MHRSRTALLIAVTLALVWIASPHDSRAGGFMGQSRLGHATPQGDADQYTNVVRHRMNIPARSTPVTGQHVDRRSLGSRLKIAIGLLRTILGAYGTVYVEQ